MYFPGFPSQAVFNAFIDPTVDSSLEPFKWGNPDLDALRTYTNSKFGWDQTKCDSLLQPVLKKMFCEAQHSSRQLTMDGFLTNSSHSGGKRKLQSQRMQNAMKKLKRVGGNGSSATVDLSEESSSSDVSSISSGDSPRKKVMAHKTQSPAKVSRKLVGGDQSKSMKPVPSVESIHFKRKEVIPQKVQEETERRRNKAKAIEILKKKGKAKKK